MLRWAGGQPEWGRDSERKRKTAKIKLPGLCGHQVSASIALYRWPEPQRKLPRSPLAFAHWTINPFSTLPLRDSLVHSIMQTPEAAFTVGIRGKRSIWQGGAHFLSISQSCFLDTDQDAGWYLATKLQQAVLSHGDTM